MNFDQLAKIEKNYKDWLKKQPHFESTKIEINENGKWALRINYHKGMPHSVNYPRPFRGGASASTNSPLIAGLTSGQAAIPVVPTVLILKPSSNMLQAAL